MRNTVITNQSRLHVYVRTYLCTKIDYSLFIPCDHSLVNKYLAKLNHLKSIKRTPSGPVTLKNFTSRLTTWSSILSNFYKKSFKFYPSIILFINWFFSGNANTYISFWFLGRVKSPIVRTGTKIIMCNTWSAVSWLGHLDPPCGGGVVQKIGHYHYSRISRPP